MQVCGPASRYHSPPAEAERRLGAFLALEGGDFGLPETRDSPPRPGTCPVTSFGLDCWQAVDLWAWAGLSGWAPGVPPAPPGIVVSARWLSSIRLAVSALRKVG